MDSSRTHHPIAATPLSPGYRLESPRQSVYAYGYHPPRIRRKVEAGVVRLVLREPPPSKGA